MRASLSSVGRGQAEKQLQEPTEGSSLGQRVRIGLIPTLPLPKDGADKTFPPYWHRECSQESFMVNIAFVYRGDYFGAGNIR